MDAFSGARFDPYAIDNGHRRIDTPGSSLTIYARR
jgi:hypothetical protein